MIGKIETENGFTYGQVKGKAQPFEAITRYSNDNIQKYGTGKVHVIRGGKPGVDNTNIGIGDGPEDNNVTISAAAVKNPYTGNSFAKDLLPINSYIEKIQNIVDTAERNFNKYADRSSLAKQTYTNIKKNAIDLNWNYKDAVNQKLNLEQLQANVKQYNEQINMPHFKEGKPDWKSIGSNIAGGLGYALPAAFSVAQGLMYGNQQPSMPNSYRSNPYGRQALNTLAQLRYNPYGDLQALRQQEREAAYANSQAGALTPVQRNAARMGLALGTQRNMSDIFSKSQQYDNQQLANYANASMQLGNADRAAMQDAYKFDYDMYAKAVAARLKGIETSMTNSSNVWQQMFADADKKRMFDKSLAVWLEEKQFDKDKFNAMMAEAKAARDAQTQSQNRSTYIGDNSWKQKLDNLQKEYNDFVKSLSDTRKSFSRMRQFNSYGGIG